MIKTGHYKTKEFFGKIILYFFLILGALAALLPFLWMLSGSLKWEKDLYNFPIEWIPQSPKWDNYVSVFKIIPFFTYFINTLKLALVITFLQVITSALAGYAFAKIPFPGRNKLFLIYLGTLMIPFQVTMIPQFILMSKLKLADTHMALILIGAFSTFGVFLLRQFFLTISDEILESARIDGCSEFRILFQIVAPMAKPAFATLIIFTFVNVWNDYLAPLIYISKDSLKTIQLGIRFFQQATTTENTLIMAATVMGLIPVLLVYFACQKQFIEGIAATGLKG